MSSKNKRFRDWLWKSGERIDAEKKK